MTTPPAGAHAGAHADAHADVDADVDDTASMTTGPGPALTLVRHQEDLAVVRLGPGADLPSWAESGTVLSVTATAAETSVVCAAAAVPRRARQAGPFRAYAVAGTLDFALTGILVRLLQPLADAGVSVFTLSTYDTDWVLVPTAARAAAESAWGAVGLAVTDAEVDA